MGATITTLMYYEPIYKNGKNINPDKNSHSTDFTCQECGCEWVEETNKNRDDCGLYRIVENN
jgi:hypothetical protein